MNAANRRFVIAVMAISLVAGCRRVSGARKAPTWQRITLTPPLARVGTRGTQQFTVKGQMSDGSTVAATVTYVATGGTITSGGRYTARSVPGIYRVIATQTGGALADTSVVMLTPAGARTYATDFPLTENPVSEGGHWLNAGTVGSDGTNVSTTPGLAIGREVGASYTDATAVLTGTWGPDQMVSATVHTAQQKEACYQEVELRLRSTISAHVGRGYEISYKCSQSPAAYLIIVRGNGALGDFTYLLRKNGAQFGVKDGDVVSASIIGHVITAYKNGVLLAEVTDSTFETGSPGMGFNLENGPADCAGTNGDYGFTRYVATGSGSMSVRPGSRPSP